MRTVVAFLIVVLSAAPASATFSIVAFDPRTGDLGVAVASRVFGVGNHVPWAEAGVGAVATQAAMNGGYGPRGLQLLREGLSAQQVLERLLAEDKFDRLEGRQVAIIDAKGNIAVHTGPAASEWKGHLTGATYSVQGNILAGPHVAQAMARAFENSSGELAERLYAALKAGDDAGGDRRGRQSASILVVRKGGGSSLNNDRLCYINVDDNPDPLLELGRLLHLQLAWSLTGKRGPLVQQGQLQEAMILADNLVKWAPRNGAHRIHQGFIAYLTGNKDKHSRRFGVLWNWIRSATNRRWTTRSRRRQRRRIARCWTTVRSCRSCRNSAAASQDAAHQLRILPVKSLADGLEVTQLTIELAMVVHGGYRQRG